MPKRVCKPKIALAGRAADRGTSGAGFKIGEHIAENRKTTLNPTAAIGGKRNGLETAALILSFVDKRS